MSLESEELPTPSLRQGVYMAGPSLICPSPTLNHMDWLCHLLVLALMFPRMFFTSLSLTSFSSVLVLPL